MGLFLLGRTILAAVALATAPAGAATAAATPTHLRHGCVQNCSWMVKVQATAILEMAVFAANATIYYRYLIPNVFLMYKIWKFLMHTSEMVFVKPFH